MSAVIMPDISPIHQEQGKALVEEKETLLDMIETIVNTVIILFFLFIIKPAMEKKLAELNWTGYYG